MSPDAALDELTDFERSTVIDALWEYVENNQGAVGMKGSIAAEVRARRVATARDLWTRMA